jgi:AAA+ ATPase superfamily predicted ATPase
MIFQNRKTELKELERIWKLCEISTHFTILTGRRRVGKTELVKKLCENKEHLYFFIGRKNIFQQLPNHDQHFHDDNLMPRDFAYTIL